MRQLEPGDLLARRYLLLEHIASGGMSVIWRALDQSLSRTVAVKVRSVSLTSGLHERERIHSEARSTASLAHPDAIEIYDYGETVTRHGDVAAYVVMRLLNGIPLAERIAGGPLPWREAVAIIARIARVLEAAHARGLVHRDVTAENVLLTSDGPKLLDFGIAARVGDPDDDCGTPPYVAPERLAGASAHPAMDLYALGVLLYSTLTGRAPYPETTWEELQTARRTSPPPRPPAVPPFVAALCQRCLAPDPALRPTARQVAESLTGRRAPRRWLLGTICLVLGSTLLGTALLSGTPAPQIPPSPPKVGVPQSTSSKAWTPEPAIGLRDAVAAFNAVLDPAECDVRHDVALDLRQVLQGVVANPDRPQIAALRRKLADRQREGGLSPTCRARLDTHLTKIATTLRRP